MEAAAKVQRQNWCALRGPFLMLAFRVRADGFRSRTGSREIDATIARSPGFFAGRPVVIDLVLGRSQPVRHRPSAHQPAGTATFRVPRDRGAVDEGRPDADDAAAAVGAAAACVVEPTTPKKTRKRRPNRKPTSPAAR